MAADRNNLHEDVECLEQKVDQINATVSNLDVEQQRQSQVLQILRESLTPMGGRTVMERLSLLEDRSIRIESQIGEIIIDSKARARLLQERMWEVVKMLLPWLAAAAVLWISKGGTFVS